MYEQMMRGLPEACEGEGVPGAGHGAIGYEAEIELRFGKAYRLKEVEEKLGISKRQVQALIDDGSLVAVNVGRGRERRDLRVLEDDLAGFVRRRSTEVQQVPPVSKPQLFGRPNPLGNNSSFSARYDAQDPSKEGR